MIRCIRLFWIVLLVMVVTVSQATPAPFDMAADMAARFKALYTREWHWRQAEFPCVVEGSSQSQCVDHLPKVDLATQTSAPLTGSRCLRS